MFGPVGIYTCTVKRWVGICLIGLCPGVRKFEGVRKFSQFARFCVPTIRLRFLMRLRQTEKSKVGSKP